jgi:hypothetical protein
LLELRDHGAGQRLGLLLRAAAIAEPLGVGLEERLVLGETLMRARCPPSTSTLTVPSGSFSSCSTVPTVPTMKMSAVVGSSCAAFFCVTSRICLSSFITSSSARTDFSRPTNSGTIMCGKTTMSRSGRTG